jgi:hypothetical protein
MSKQTDLINIPDAITVSGSNVGIGTTSPSSNYGFSKTVEIQGGVNSELSLSQTNNSKDWSFGVGNGNCYQQTNSGQNYSWYTGGVEKLRIQSGGGISFNGDTAAANALNDYEEGTWTPSIVGGTVTNNNRSTYVKIGNLVTLYTYITFTTANNGSPFFITGIPFNQTSTTAYYASGHGISYSHILDTTSLGAPLISPSDEIYFHYLSGSSAQVPNSFFTGTTRHLILSVAYQTDA